MIPDAVGPDDRDRAADADLQAVRLGPLYPSAPREAELAQPALEEFPRRLARFARAAALLLAHRAEEDMTFDRVAADQRERRARLGDVFAAHVLRRSFETLGLHPRSSG